jgi:hypothetical protein
VWAVELNDGCWALFPIQNFRAALAEWRDLLHDDVPRRDFYCMAMLLIKKMCAS